MEFKQFKRGDLIQINNTIFKISNIDRKFLTVLSIENKDMRLFLSVYDISSLQIKYLGNISNNILFDLLYSSWQRLYYP